MSILRERADEAATSFDVLFASSEALPLIKTGGLADVAGSLPVALRSLGHDARLILPAYPRALKQVRELRTACELRLPGALSPVRLLSGFMPDRDLPVYLVDAPEHFCREGNPYTDVSGRDWGDNAERFLLFSWAVATVAMGVPALNWRPQLLHCNDWQTALAPALMRDREERPATVFTIHNLAYQGLFDRATFDRLKLPPALWSVAGLEFHQRLSFIKGGIIFADRVNTVSPTYADEVRTSQHGCGLDGLLRQIGGRFQGILNGIDYHTWNPATDPALTQPYDTERLHLKAGNKLELQRLFDLPRNEHTFVLGYIGRLVEQKGVDLIVEMLPWLLEDPRVQVVMQGSGEANLELMLKRVAEAHPDRVGTYVGYDEGRAHLIEAGCDAFLMPSRFEPCGLNQMYSLRYGCVPIVRRTGGLADTVSDGDRGPATGFLFEEPSAEALCHKVREAVDLWHNNQDAWRARMRAGMEQDISWEASARQYQHYYADALEARQNLERALA
ncbi:glycogen synthase GlgA [Rhabdochromatium marinum]|uniref:glycogen synthase GlgA n=1 Tax=Rhabdochromatium marinum TaxID=48729 RepID=UPI001908A7B8|nr:glycogen synthase GlgA [Rhabdochromatium marinum]MBK1649571.1 starch synthase [Rhabdochromatium marinum]